ncbi:alpha-1,2-fucosyltransferase [Endozoicomonas sp. Mp262]|uniref:alpha-1,2-fucosyltransferase n=1 Tax=Endozoicomonas sp. Mp262 TaxID=2919499 RepID=UPI0021DAEE23
MKKKTKNVFLCGGFGNNLFQIALGYYFEKKGYNVIYNTFFIEKGLIVKLLGWKIHDSSYTKKFLSQRKSAVKKNIGFCDFLFLVFAFAKKRISGNNFMVFKDCLYSENKKRYFGYWQKGDHLSHAVLDDLSKSIKIIFKKQCGLQGEKKFPDSVIHLRRGDFNKNRVLDISYYKRAIGVVGDCKYLLISGENIYGCFVSKELGVEIIENKESSFENDFCCMLNAKVLICSNSTFCFWAAQLGHAEIIIYPDKLEEGKEWFFDFSKNNVHCVKSSFLSEKHSELGVNN